MSRVSKNAMRSSHACRKGSSTRAPGSTISCMAISKNGRSAAADCITATRLADHATGDGPGIAASLRAGTSSRDRKECLEDVDNFGRLVVLQPVPGAFDSDQFGLPEMLEHAGGLGIRQETLAAADQQRRTLDARPQRDVVLQRQPVGRAGAKIWIELPAIGAVGIPLQAVHGQMVRLLARQPPVTRQDALGSIGWG